LPRRIGKPRIRRTNFGVWRAGRLTQRRNRRRAQHLLDQGADVRERLLVLEREEALRAAEVRVDLVLRALLDGGVGGHEEEEGGDAGGGLPAGASVHGIGREEATGGRIIYGIALTVCAPPA
jgi:hypothetical protein